MPKKVKDIKYLHAKQLQFRDWPTLCYVMQQHSKGHVYGK